MVHHGALRVGSTSTCAGIAAMLLDAGQRGWTLRVVNTFGTAASAVGITEVGLNAAATCGIIVWRAHGVLGTRVRVAGIDVILWFWRKINTVNTKPRIYRRFVLLTLFDNLGAADEGIALVALIAATVRRVGHDCAACIVSAGVGTWILTLLLDAGLVGRTLAAQRTLRTAVWWTTYVVGHT